MHLLPRHYWGYTATGQPTATVRSRRPASPNPGLEVMAAWWSDDVVHTHVPVPIMDLRQEDLVRWAQAVVTGSTWTDAVWAQAPEDVTTVQAGIELTADDRVRAFRSRASTGAQALARVLAGAPLLSLPLIHVLHQQLLPNPETSQLAEVLVSDLLEKLPDSAGDSPLLRFQPGVADLLYQGTSASQEWDIFDVLTQHIEHNASSGNTVRAVIADPNGTATVSGDLVPFAAMGRGVASRLGISMPAQTATPDPRNMANSAAPQPDAPRPDHGEVPSATDFGEPEPQPRWPGEPSHTRLVMIARTSDPVLAGSKFDSLGTGFLLAPRLILTAAHIMNRRSQRGILKVRNKRGTITADGWVNCHLLWTHENCDAVLLIAEEDLAEPATDSHFSTPRWAQPTGNEAIGPCYIPGAIVSNETGPQVSGHLTGTLHPTSSHHSAGYEFEPAASLAQPRNTKSFARGMSGAPVFFGKFLLGFVIAMRDGSRLAVAGIGSLVNDRGFIDACSRYMRHVPRLDLLPTPSVHAGDDHAEGGLAGHRPARVFISYAHEDDNGAHAKQVRKLGQLLRAEGIDIRLDQFPAEGRQDWATWMRQEMEIADVILVIASPAYKHRAESGDADSSVGVAFEARLLRNELAHHPVNVNQRILPVLLPGSTSKDLPAFLRPLHSLAINPITRTGADQLLHRLTHGPPDEDETSPTAQGRRSSPLAEYSAITKCLPTYLVLDTSASMHPHEAQLNATLDHLHMSLASSPQVAEFAHISIVTFNTRPHVALEMTDLEEISALPQLRCGGQTNIGAAFDLVRNRIEVDVPALRAANKAVLRPAVFLLTDGQPTDTATWRRHWNRLMDPTWPRRPHVLTFGFGNATIESLRGMATKAAYLANESLATEDALSRALNTMANTLSASAPRGALVVPDALAGFERIPVDYVE